MVNHGYPWLNKIMGDLDTFIVNVFAGVRGRLAPAFAGGAGGGSPLLHGMDHGLWSMVHFPWSMVHGPFWPSFSRKNRPEYCFLQYIGALWEFIRGFHGFSGSSGSSGNGVRNHRSDPPFHGQEFSDDGSSQQTPSNKDFVRSAHRVSIVLDV